MILSPRFFPNPFCFKSSWSVQRISRLITTSSPSVDSHIQNQPAKLKWFSRPNTTLLFLWMIFGSQAIHLLQIKHAYSEYVLWSKGKISLLKDIIERIQNGQQVDLKKELGTGNPKKELEWEELIAEIERDSRAWKKKSEHPGIGKSTFTRSSNDQE